MLEVFEIYQPPQADRNKIAGKMLGHVLIVFAALAVVTALCAVVIRKQAPGIAMTLVLLGVAMILRGSLSAISGVRGVVMSCPPRGWRCPAGPCPR